MKIEAVDLFCGIGGLTYGVKKAGINVVAGVDVDATCKYAYTENNKALFVEKAIEELTCEEVKAFYKKDVIKVLMGCAPCQPFSRYSYRYNKKGYKDNKWKLLYEFIRVVKGVKPNIISMENVPKLVKTEIFGEFVGTLKELGYFVSWSISNCAEYRVPQNRLRLVLLASEFSEIPLIDATCNKDNYVTVRDAISHLDKIDNGEISKNDFMHKANRLSDLNLRRIKQSKPGENWSIWDRELLLKCHKKESGKTYKSVYGRMDWDKPSPTITTQFYGYGNGRFGHPEQNRAISLREGAILQSFPDEYKFFSTDKVLSNRELGIHIGNAVPVNLGIAIGESIIQHVKSRC